MMSKYACTAILAGLLLNGVSQMAFGANAFAVRNLVSDLPNLADHVDANLTNPWGIAFSPKSPFWVGNNHSGTSTIYDGSGNPASLVVSIPVPGDTTGGAVTGVIFNGSASFPLPGGKPAVFIFCTEDGTISGWNSAADPRKALIMVDNSASGAVYKGCEIGGSANAPMLYAANFNSGRVDVWDGNLAPVSNAAAFVDSAVPAGFAPFNIRNLGNKLYVTYAKQDAAKHDDVPGAGNGYIAMFDMQGNLLQHLASNGPLSSPWGMAIAPAAFGDFGGDLLAGNFTDGTINAFDPKSGAFAGSLNDAAGKPVAMPGLWALTFGNGASGGDTNTLYFTAGIGGSNGDTLETHGLLGSIQAAPSIQTSSVLNSASSLNDLAPNSFVSIFGNYLSATTRVWQDSDFADGKLPVQLDGVSVSFNGSPAYVSFVSPGQINALIPTDIATGPAKVEVTANGLKSGYVDVTLAPAAPEFFNLGNSKYAIGTHADGASLIGPVNLLAGVATSPVKPGETIVLYGTGFGATNPAAPKGQLIQSPLNLAAKPTVTIGGLPAQVTFAGLISAGLYQVNVVTPTGLTSGDAQVVANAAGASSRPGVLVSVDAPVVKPPDPYTAKIANFAFVPTPITVTVGAALTWTNTDGAAHTVVSDDGKFSSQSLNQNGMFTVNLTSPGTYNYHCSIHPFMKGTVIVK